MLVAGAYGRWEIPAALTAATALAVLVVLVVKIRSHGGVSRGLGRLSSEVRVRVAGPDRRESSGTVAVRVEWAFHSSSAG